MDRHEGQARARDALHAALTERGWGLTDLAHAASVDVGTVSDFLRGTRWPYRKTQGKIEKALDWTPGRIERFAQGTESLPPTDRSEQLARRAERSGVHKLRESIAELRELDLDGTEAAERDKMVRVMERLVNQRERDELNDFVEVRERHS